MSWQDCYHHHLKKTGESANQDHASSGEDGDVFEGENGDLFERARPDDYQKRTYQNGLGEDFVNALLVYFPACDVVVVPKKCSALTGVVAGMFLYNERHALLQAKKLVLAIAEEPSWAGVAKGIGAQVKKSNVFHAFGHMVACFHKWAVENKWESMASHSTKPQRVNKRHPSLGAEDSAEISDPVMVLAESMSGDPAAFDGELDSDGEAKPEQNFFFIEQTHNIKKEPFADGEGPHQGKSLCGQSCCTFGVACYETVEERFDLALERSMVSKSGEGKASCNGIATGKAPREDLEGGVRSGIWKWCCFK